MTNSTLNKKVVIKGTSASEGIAIGNLVYINQKRREVVQKPILKSDIEKHLANFIKARDKLVHELGEMLNYLDRSTSEIIETQKQIVLDVEIESKVAAIIRDELVASDYAIHKTFSDFIERLEESGSELFRQRIIDLENLRDRLIDLIYSNQNDIEVNDKTILVAKEISPTDLVSYHEKGISGLVLEKGGVTSHAALIAQSLDIPCLVNAKHATLKVGTETAILDGREGLLILSPTNDELDSYQKKLNKLNRVKRRLLKNISEPSVTKSGSVFNLAANIEFETELKSLEKYNAKDIGLLRTEGLLFNGKTSFDEQVAFYKSALKSVSGKVTFRLFDVGGDKLSKQLPIETNPFLGWRGIRLLLDKKELLIEQLKALFTSAYKFPGRVQILVPMVSVVEEIQELKKVIKTVLNNLRDEGINITENIPVGVMIEIPSAALNADNIAKHVDFMSIGTNDLTQYTFAVDRGNERICELYQQHHPAIWRLINLTAQSAKNNDIPLSVCGELAGTELGASGLLGLGINNLSMMSSSIPKVKEELISHKEEEFKELANRFVEASTSKEVEFAFEEWRNYR